MDEFLLLQAEHTYEPDMLREFDQITVEQGEKR